MYRILDFKRPISKVKRCCLFRNYSIVIVQNPKSSTYTIIIFYLEGCQFNNLKILFYFAIKTVISTYYNHAAENNMYFQIFEIILTNSPLSGALCVFFYHLSSFRPQNSYQQDLLITNPIPTKPTNFEGV